MNPNLKAIEAADTQTLEHVLEDLNAWYDLTNGWRDSEGESLSYENAQLADKCDIVFSALCDYIASLIKTKEATA